MKKPESEKLLYILRMLNKKMNPADPLPTDVREFRDLFNQLDVLLKSGAQLPTSWITRENFNQLPTETTHTITDFDPPTEEQLRKRGLAWCGHPFVQSTEYCNTKPCGNYIYTHKSSANQKILAKE